MVNSIIDNRPICVRLDGNESVTVPSGEEWRVKLVGNINNYPEILLNGTIITRIRNETPTITDYYHFTSGDTIESLDNSVLVTGFVTN